MEGEMEQGAGKVDSLATGLKELTDDHVKAVCQPGTTECCRFLMMSPDGWECGKFTTVAGLLNRRVAQQDIRAVGDNCEGRI